ncbi:Hypothetical predicted protein [Paramuricea clavata]|uniref:Uncharacterized protein n=1 Tax=Paramuricea clavata TaxID=317549 RepID=A0A6S7JWB1_PARCT|nr:Hypothetical predicted protein [Paramuricea clavata]
MGYRTLSYLPLWCLVYYHHRPQPLLGIFKSQKPTSARIDRWKLRLMRYDCEVVYKPGKDAENPADFLSRHPNPVASSPTDNTTEAYINYFRINLIPKAMKLDKVKNETANDPVLFKLSDAITHNRWLDPEVNRSLT